MRTAKREGPQLRPLIQVVRGTRSSVHEQDGTNGQDKVDRPEGSHSTDDHGAGAPLIAEKFPNCVISAPSSALLSAAPLSKPVHVSKLSAASSDYMMARLIVRVTRSPSSGFISEIRRGLPRRGCTVS